MMVSSSGTVLAAATAAIVGLGALAAPWTFSWSGVAILLALWWITGGLGICLGYHRQFTHQSYKTYPWVRHVLLTLGCLANEGAPIVWVGTHRLHHKHADHHDDPHSPNTGGFAWGHMMWAFFYEHAGARRAAKDLARDPFELDNIAATADAALLSALSAKLNALRSCQAAACRDAEDSPL